MDWTKDKLEEIFDALKGLEMAPTPNNVSIMDGVYSTLRELYHKAEEKKDGRAEDGGTERTTADPA